MAACRVRLINWHGPPTASEGEHESVWSSSRFVANKPRTPDDHLAGVSCQGVIDCGHLGLQEI